MQALHFSFALGAVLAPLLAKLAWSTSESFQNHTEFDFDPLLLNPSSEATSDSLFAVPENMNLLWAYASTGTYILVVSVFLFGLFCIKHSRQKKTTDSAQGARRAKYHRTLLCLLFVFFFCCGFTFFFDPVLLLLLFLLGSGSPRCVWAIVPTSSGALPICLHPLQEGNNSFGLWELGDLEVLFVVRCALLFVEMCVVLYVVLYIVHMIHR